MGVRARQFRTGGLVWRRPPRLQSKAIKRRQHAGLLLRRADANRHRRSDWARLPTRIHPADRTGWRPGRASDIAILTLRAGRDWLALRTLAATHQSHKPWPQNPRTTAAPSAVERSNSKD